MASTLPPSTQIESLSATVAEAAAQAARRASRLSILRLLAFIGLVALSVLLFAEVHVVAAIAAVIIGLAAFNQLVGRQQKLDREREHLNRQAELLDRELRSVAYELEAEDVGEDFLDAAHPYSGDLDLFGANSLFQLLNRTGCLIGREALASYMRNALQDREHIEQRQAAVAELAPLLAWRTAFAAHGATTLARAGSIDKLRQWAAAPNSLVESWWPAAIFGLSVFNVLWLASFVYLPFYLALVGYAPTVWLLRRAKPHVDQIHKQTEEAVELLGNYQQMIAAIQTPTWSSAVLQILTTLLRAGDGQSASVALRQLSQYSRQLALRVNPFVLLLNLFSLWEIRYARKLERWKQQHLNTQDLAEFPASLRFDLPSARHVQAEGQRSTRLDVWLLALGAVDALSSFAAAAFRWPHWRQPSFHAQSEIAGQGLHHPLLHPERSVANDFSTPTQGHIKLLTGSNMAGKSTFLRTVGLNIVMAHWGCHVPAESLSLPLLQVYTSMRTQDDLHEGASAFYAELQRLRIVVEATRRGDRVFFLLDEILKGTNSQDRHEGGRALIEQLIRQGGAGIVATHDLELGSLAEQTSAVETIRLEVETNQQGELYFDYTVKPGLAQSRNASVLMAQMGLGTPD